MLTRLYIKDFALIAETEIEFGRGLNAITGETGAGKSILIGALNSILGGPIHAGLVRNGADKCIVEGFFEFTDDDDQTTRLAEHDVHLEDGQLILRREIHGGSRSRAFVNGQGQPVKKLKEIGSILVDLHGQHEHQSLLDPKLHSHFVDSFGELEEIRRLVSEYWHEYRKHDAQLAQLHQERRALIAEDDMRSYQLREIRLLSPQPGEESELERELQILENAEELVQNSLGIYDQLYQREGAVYEELGQIRRQLDRLQEIDPSLGPQTISLSELIYGVEDLARHLRDYVHTIEVKPGRADELRERLNGLRELKKKYGASLEQVLQYEKTLDKTTDMREQSLTAFAGRCLALSEARKEVGEILSKSLVVALQTLGITQARFCTILETIADPDGPIEHNGERFAAGEHGMESATFHFSANVGEALRPLDRIASGGEISRVMLALKELIAGRDLVSVLVFDEIDAGISGHIASAVGRKLQALSDSHQIIVITHLPQIASLANHHFSVRKRELGHRTITEVATLDEKARTEEIAYLLAGETISSTALQHAQEMLQ